MKKYLIYMVLPVLLASTYSCAEDPGMEDPFIDISDGEDDEKSGNPYWDWADKYPGPVSALAPRVYDVQVPVRGNSGVIGYAPETPVLQSTGLYAPADARIEVVVPDGVTDLHYQIGLGHELPEVQVKFRYKDVVTKGSLHPGTNTVMSYFGGYLYFYFPAGTTHSDVTVTVSGTVESYDFILGETDVKEWTTTIQERARLLEEGSQEEDSLAFLNWVELRSDKVILTMGVPGMSVMTNPETILQYYGNIADAYLRFGGYDPTGHPPMRVYTDVQVPDPNQNILSPELGSYYYGGYPTGYVRGQNTTTFVDEKRLLNPHLLQAQTDDGGFGNWFAVLYGFSDTVKEDWQTAPYLQRPSYVMGYYHYARSMGLWPGKFINFSNEVANLNITLPFLDNTNKYLKYDKESDDTRTTMMMQLAVHLDWGLFPYLNERAKELGFVNEYDQDAHDFFVMGVCEYAGQNYLEFFRKWHFPFTEYAARYCKQFPEPSTPFWTSFNNNNEPAFASRTPNRDFTRGPKPYPKWYEDKTDWYLTTYVEHAITGDSLRTLDHDSANNNDQSRIIDGDPDSWGALGGHLTWQGEYGSLGPAADSLSHVVYCTLEFGDEPIKVNALSVWHQQIYFINRFHNIEYWDDAAQQWKPTVPDEIRVQDSNQERYYYFEESFETTKMRWNAQPKVNNWQGDYRLMYVRELGVGLVE